MIRVYPSTLEGEPLETHMATEGTLHQWMLDNVPSYRDADYHPVSATVRGRVVPPEQWDSVTLDNDVELRPQPGDPVTLAYVVVAAVIAVAAAVILAPSIPSVSNKSSKQGRSLYEVNAEGNQAKLGDLIPELAGRHRMFPDYLNSPRRYFVDKTSQVLEMLLCIGVGEFEIDTSEIRIGETPIDALGAGVSYQIFGPGESVTGHPAHRCWYNVPEVGATSGSSGLRLRSTDSVTYDGTVTASGNRLTFPVPDSWDDSMWTTVKLYQTITVVDGGNSSSDTQVITGFTTVTDPETGEETQEPVYGTIAASSPLPDEVHGDWTGLAEGDRIRITSEDLNATLIIASISGSVMTLSDLSGAPVTNLPAGSYEAAVDVQGVRYSIQAIASDNSYIEVFRLDDDDNVDPNWSSFPSLTGSANVSVTTGSPGTWTGPFQACPDDEVVDLIQFDIFAANGRGRLNDDGDVHGLRGDVELQYRPVGSSEWTSVIRSFSGNTLDQIGWTFTVPLGSLMVPEVRMRRVNSENKDSKYLDKLDWYGLRSEIPKATSYPNVTSIALTITGSNTLASQSENQLSVVPVRKLPTREAGAWTEPRATRNIAPWAAYVAKDAGWSDDDIDFDELDRLDALWRLRGDYFDFVTDDDSTVKESINRALTAGFAELTIDRGKIKPVRDEPRGELPQHGYSAQNMLQGSFSRTINLPQPDDADGIDVEYIDEDSWTSEVVECRLPGDAGDRVENKKVEGVLSRTRAWRIGMRERRKQRYRREAYEFETELDALNSTYMSHVAITDDVPGYGSSGRVVSAELTGDGVVLQVSEELDFSTGTGHVIAWRRMDGTLSGPHAATQVSSHTALLDSDEMPEMEANAEPPYYQFGTLTHWAYDALVEDLIPNGFETVSVTAVNNDPRVYADDDEEPS